MPPTSHISSQRSPFSSGNVRRSPLGSRRGWGNGRQAEEKRNALSDLAFYMMQDYIAHRMSTAARQQAIAQRLKALREDRGVTQEQLSQALGFKDRQTLAAIEAGERRIA